MNKEITSSIQVDYWKNSSVVIKWFRNLENNSSSLVIIFDIEDFYSSILLSAFNRAIEFGKEISNSLNDENSMIMITRETLLFSDGEAWVKKNEEDAFDVPLGLYDGAEMCELVGTYLLNQLKVAIGKENMGLSRDDSLGIFKSMPQPETEKKKK